MVHNGEKPKRYGKSKLKSIKCEICEKEFCIQVITRYT